MSWTAIGTALLACLLVVACGPSPAEPTATATSESGPVSAFGVDVEQGSAPHAAAFTDQSKNSPTGWHWDFGDGGTSAERSPVHRYEQAGIYDVTLVATNGAGDDSSTALGLITVVPGELARIEVSQESGLLPVGGQQSFGLTGWDQFDNQVTILDPKWEAIDDAGAIAADGTFVASNVAGVYSDGLGVSTASGGVTWSAFVDITVVHGALATLILQGSSEQVAIGESTRLVASAADEFGNEVPTAAIRWESPGQHQISEDGLFSAGTVAGAATIVGSLTVDGVTVEAETVLQVLPGSLVSLGIEPITVTLDAGADQRFVATALDEHGNAISGLETSWRTLTSAGVLDGQGNFVASSKPGEYGEAVEVTVTSGDSTLTAVANVAVTVGPLSKVVLGPKAIELGIGMTQSYVAAAGDRFGNLIPGIEFAWSAIGAGSIDSTGLFTGGDIPGVFPDAIAVSATQGDTTVTSSGQVTINPDRISFLAAPTGSFSNQIYLTNVTGGEIELLAETAFIGSYSWSPDGRHVAVAVDSTITVMDQDGGNREVVIEADSSTNPATRVTQPLISPDGTQIAFVYSTSPLSASGFPAFPWESTEIYVMDIDGGNLRQVTDEPDVEKFDPSWSSDGTQIAYTHNTKPIRWDLWMVNADGTENRAVLVTTTGTLASNPSWSPDGTKLLFRIWRSGGAADISGSTDVGVADLATGSITLLTDDQELDYGATWSPDGSQIAFYSNRAGGWAIFVMESDGTGMVQVTGADVEARHPRWVPRTGGTVVEMDSLVLATEAPPE